MISKYCKQFGLTLLLFLSFLSAAIPQKSWDFGGKKFNVGVSAPLKVSFNSGSLTSRAFLGRVGGIAFAQIAEPFDNIKGEYISISYNKYKKDGKRFMVNIGNDKFYPKVYDWQLVPIAKFADSEFHACVSLTENYGETSYHTAFQNTLIGLRLFHADIFLTDIETFKKLPAFDGEVVLGEGELNNVSSSFETSKDKIDSLMRAYLFEFNSWIIHDDSSEIQFGIKNDKFIIIGEPYYHFWASDHSLEDSVIILKDMNKAFQKSTEDIYNLNNDVYNATQNTMRYAAFFRYIKNNNPNNWNRFLKRIDKVEIKPKVETPNN